MSMAADRSTPRSGRGSDDGGAQGGGGGDLLPAIHEDDDQAGPGEQPQSLGVASPPVMNGRERSQGGGGKAQGVGKGGGAKTDKVTPRPKPREHTTTETQPSRCSRCTHGLQGGVLESQFRLLEETGTGGHTQPPLPSLPNIPMLTCALGLAVPKILHDGPLTRPRSCLHPFTQVTACIE